MKWFQIHFRKGIKGPEQITVVTAITNTDAVKQFYQVFPSVTHKILSIKWIRPKL